MAPDSALGESDFVVPLGTPVIGGLGFRVRAAQAHWWATTGVGQTSLGLATSLVREGDVSVDVGANIGVFSVCAAKLVGPGGQVIAFEPDHSAQSLLHENLTRHGADAVVEVRQSGVGASSPAPEVQGYENELRAVNEEAADPAGLVESTVIDVVTLDDSIHDPVRFVNVAVQGFEPEVLDGAQALLQRSPDAALLIECNPACLAAAGFGLSELLKRLPSTRWNLWLIDETGALGPKVAAFDDDARTRIESAPPDWYGSLLAVPVHRVHEVENAVQSLGL